jgi:prevent-host-death family protein
MSRYSVAEAKNTLPSLIDKAASGEQVIITRHGKPVAELRPMVDQDRRPGTATYEWMRARRQASKAITITSVELLNKLHDETDF